MDETIEGDIDVMYLKLVNKNKTKEPCPVEILIALLQENEQSAEILCETWGSRSPADPFPRHKKFWVHNSTTEFHFVLREGVRRAPVVLSGVMRNSEFNTERRNLISI